MADEYKWLCEKCFRDASHEGTCVKTIANNFGKRCMACGLLATRLCDSATVDTFVSGNVKK